MMSVSVPVWPRPSLRASARLTRPLQPTGGLRRMGRAWPRGGMRWQSGPAEIVWLLGWWGVVGELPGWVAGSGATTGLGRRSAWGGGGIVHLLTPPGCAAATAGLSPGAEPRAPRISRASSTPGSALPHTAGSLRRATQEPPAVFTARIVPLDASQGDDRPVFGPRTGPPDRSSVSVSASGRAAREVPHSGTEPPAGSHRSKPPVAQLAGRRLSPWRLQPGPVAAASKFRSPALPWGEQGRQPAFDAPTRAGAERRLVRAWPGRRVAPPSTGPAQVERQLLAVGAFEAPAREAESPAPKLDRVGPSGVERRSRLVQASTGPIGPNRVGGVSPAGALQGPEIFEPGRLASPEQLWLTAPAGGDARSQVDDGAPTRSALSSAGRSTVASDAVSAARNRLAPGTGAARSARSAGLRRSAERWTSVSASRGIDAPDHGAPSGPQQVVIAPLKVGDMVSSPPHEEARTPRTVIASTRGFGQERELSDVGSLRERGRAGPHGRTYIQSERADLGLASSRVTELRHGDGLRPGGRAAAQVPATQNLLLAPRGGLSRPPGGGRTPVLGEVPKVSLVTDFEAAEPVVPPDAAGRVVALRRLTAASGRPLAPPFGGRPRAAELPEASRHEHFERVDLRSPGGDLDGVGRPLVSAQTGVGARAPTHVRPQARAMPVHLAMPSEQGRGAAQPVEETRPRRLDRAVPSTPTATTRQPLLTAAAPRAEDAPPSSVVQPSSGVTHVPPQRRAGASDLAESPTLARGEGELVQTLRALTRASPEARQLLKDIERRLAELRRLEDLRRF